MFSESLRRTVDLEFLTPAERALPAEAKERRLREFLGGQAAALGLTLEEWAALVRGGCPPGATVFTGDLQKPGIFERLLSPRLPELSQALRRKRPGLPQAAWAEALRNIAFMRPPEGLFWDRLYLDFARILESPEDACESALMRLARKKSLAAPLMEYAGFFAPLRDFEEMPHERAVAFLGGHIRKWSRGRAKKRPRHAEAQLLAADLYNASRIFRIPFTYLTVIFHQHCESGGKWPGALEVYCGSRALAALVNSVKRTWSEGSAPICDLEETVRHFPVAERSPGVFQEKYAALIESFRQEFAPKLFAV
jgi:hypothetical protein